MIAPCFMFGGFCDDNRRARAALVRVVRGPAVLWRLRAIGHAVVPDDAGNTQPVIIENPGTPLGLGFAMLGNVAPCREGLLVAEERQRQDLAFLGQAFEPFDRDEAIDGFQDRPQFGREIEIFCSVLRPGPDLENHGDHLLLLLCAGMFYAGMFCNVNLRRNVRSSARMNLLSSAKLKLAMPSWSARRFARY